MDAVRIFSLGGLNPKHIRSLFSLLFSFSLPFHFSFSYPFPGFSYGVWDTLQASSVEFKAKPHPPSILGHSEPERTHFEAS